MNKTRIDPSRNAEDNQVKGLYGYVIRVPNLPPAHKKLVDFTVFNEEDNLFYKCIETRTDTRLEYSWLAVTFGAQRAYLIPVGKLTALDKQKIREKDDVRCLPLTLNELVFGFRRYGEIFQPIGYKPATGTFQSGVTYYKWHWYDEVIGLEWKPGWYDTVDGQVWKSRRPYTGEMVAMVEGTDYHVGDEIVENTVYFDRKDWSAITNVEIMNKINEIGKLLNDHSSGIPQAMEQATETDTLNHFCNITNLIIDEVNPFSIPWQLIIDRLNMVEWREECLERDVGDVRDWKDWEEVEWLNYIGPELTYGTVVAAVDSALNLIKFYDQKIGPLAEIIDVKSTETLVSYLKSLEARIRALEARDVIHTEALKQLRESLGDCGFVFTPDLTFNSGHSYFKWDTTENYFKILRRESGDYEYGDSIAAWEAAHGCKVYEFFSNKTADWRITFNAAEIVRNRKEIDELLGTELHIIRIETVKDEVEKYQQVLEPTAKFRSDLVYYRKSGTSYIKLNSGTVPSNTTYVVGTLVQDWVTAYSRDVYTDVVYSYCNLDKRETGDPVFVNFVPAAGKDLAYYRKLYGVVFRNCNSATAIDQIRDNNRFLGIVRQLIRGCEINILNLQEDLRKLKILTGVEGDTADASTWEVNGYIKLTAPGLKFEDVKNYYVLRPDIHEHKGEYIELVANEDYFIGDLIADYGEPVFIRDVKWADCNTHRGLIDRNTKDLARHKKWTKDNMVALENFVLELQLSTIDIITQERATFTLIHQTLDRLITIHNAMERLDEHAGWKIATGQYESGYDYYKLPELNPWTQVDDDETAKPYKLYYKRSGQNVWKYQKTGVWQEGVKNYFYTNRHVLEACNTAMATEGMEYWYGTTKYTPTQSDIGKSTIGDRDVTTLSIKVQSNLTYHDNRGGFSTAVVPKDEIGSVGEIIAAAPPADGSPVYRSVDDYIPTVSEYFFDNGGTTYEKVILNNEDEFWAKYDEVGELFIQQKWFKSNLAYEKNGGFSWEPTSESGVVFSIDPIDELVESQEEFEDIVRLYGEWGPIYYEVQIQREIYQHVHVQTGKPLPPLGADKHYYTPNVHETPLQDGVDYEVGLEVGEHIFTKDIVIATVENYTEADLRMAVNRLMTYHIDSGELPDYTEVPNDAKILATLLYYRWINDSWEEIDPEVDDPSMIGQRIKDYDPDHSWYIHTGAEIVETGYTENQIRVFLNEIIKMHRHDADHKTVLRDLANAMIARLMAPMNAREPVGLA